MTMEQLTHKSTTIEKCHRDIHTKNDNGTISQKLTYKNMIIGKCHKNIHTKNDNGGMSQKFTYKNNDDGTTSQKPTHKK
jgi:hypothetical protein